MDRNRDPIDPGEEPVSGVIWFVYHRICGEALNFSFIGDRTLAYAPLLQYDYEKPRSGTSTRKLIAVRMDSSPHGMHCTKYFESEATCVSLVHSTPKSLYQAMYAPSRYIPKVAAILTRNRTAQQLLKARLNHRHSTSMLEWAGFHSAFPTYWSGGHLPNACKL